MRRVNWVRRVIGGIAVVLMVAVIAAFVLGAGSDNVFLHQYFGNPALGAFLALALSIIVFMMLAPVQSEASQYRRSRFRTVQVIVTFLALIVYGFTFGLGVFDYKPTVVQHSADGTRSAATFRVGPSKHLHVLAGKGLSARDVGDVGLVCGENVDVKFDTDSLMTVETDFGTYKINLDPATGRPLNQFPSTCGG
jgi:succinate dehydrogenase hydrophobic anchor subunit